MVEQSATTVFGDSFETRVPARFTGTRWELFWRMLRGYLLMVPTLGLYRFWVTTTKRRFYWSNTSIGGDTLEYTGTPQQLLVGFLFALAVFLPIYVGFFYLSTQVGEVVLIGYGVVGVLLWFLAGYAIYRGRDFRLSRTLWRGIRFGQEGSAWAYALRRFLWSLLVFVTLGLAYPFMVGDLWRYRYRHTWYGDRAFSFGGSWKTVAGPFYRAYGVMAVIALIAVLAAVGSGGAALAFVPLLTLVVGAVCFIYYRARETSRMYSQVQLGEARLTVTVKARSLAGQYAGYLGLLLLALIVAGVIGFVIVAAVQGQFDMTTAAGFVQAGWIGIAMAVGGYLATLAIFSLLGEVLIDCGFWMLVARGASIANLASLDDVRAGDEDMALAGEGLADALNVGSF